MIRFSAVVVSALLAALVVAPAGAQQPGTPNDPHHPAPPAGAPAPPPPAPGAGRRNADMPMMDACRQMMADMMGMPMMGGADPKERADMLRMRGEMMKAMGEIMMKYAGRMHGGPSK